MAANREELRDRLLAALHAAEELPREERTHLADAFLDGMDAEYRLVPRAAGSTSTEPRPRRARRLHGSGPWAPFGMAAGLFLLLPLLFITLLFALHAPFLIFVVAILLFARFGRHGMWARRRATWY